MFRVLTLTALSVALAGTPATSARAQQALPDMGSSAAEQLTPAQEAIYGAMTLRELRRLGMLLEDPLLDAWYHGMAYRLVASDSRTRQDYTFMLLRDRQINAFATVGGYIGMNSGLILAAEVEDEVAGVLAHEIAHVTQKHVLRAVERAQKDSVPILLGMLAAVVAAQQAGSRSSGDATQAAIAGGLSLIQQRQIDYTRSNESEADRIGIQRLAAAGYDPLAMAQMFGRMSRFERNNTGGRAAPEYLRTHPVTTTRMSEARERAERMRASQTVSFAGGPMAANPLLPGGLGVSADATGRPGARFAWAQERLRVLTADSPNAAAAEYTRMRAAGERFGPPQRYGMALAQLRMGHGAEALQELKALAEAEPGDLWIELALAEAEFAAGHAGTARQRFERLAAGYPNNRAVALTYARVLGEVGTAEAGRRAQELLRPLLRGGSDDPELHVRFARASELAGDLSRAAEAHAEVAFLNGRAEDALNQLQALKADDDLDYYQRARIDARIAAMTPIVLEMRRQGLRPEDQGRGVVQR
ncbi:M48 family metalloprotease [Coralloluteibacterium thermophilus]|uniref:Putative beta-barrel assembly-enhancing protease n=1 Tax=Coralloluteibacterium thermophilum TaxID=2707049 RepID=A0ABV9NNE4_9GAMM